MISIKHKTEKFGLSQNLDNNFNIDVDNENYGVVSLSNTKGIKMDIWIYFNSNIGLPLLIYKILNNQQKFLSLPFILSGINNVEIIFKNVASNTTIYIDYEDTLDMVKSTSRIQDTLTGTVAISGGTKEYNIWSPPKAKFLQVFCNVQSGVSKDFELYTDIDSFLFYYDQKLATTDHYFLSEYIDISIVTAQGADPPLINLILTNNDGAVTFSLENMVYKFLF